MLYSLPNNDIQPEIILTVFSGQRTSIAWFGWSTTSWICHCINPLRKYATWPIQMSSLSLTGLSQELDIGRFWPQEESTVRTNQDLVQHGRCCTRRLMLQQMSGVGRNDIESCLEGPYRATPNYPRSKNTALFDTQTLPISIFCSSEKSPTCISPTKPFWCNSIREYCL